MNQRHLIYTFIIAICLFLNLQLKAQNAYYLAAQGNFSTSLENSIKTNVVNSNFQFQYNFNPNFRLEVGLGYGTENSEYDNALNMGTSYPHYPYYTFSYPHELDYQVKKIIPNLGLSYVRNIHSRIQIGLTINAQFIAAKKTQEQIIYYWSENPSVNPFFDVQTNIGVNSVTYKRNTLQTSIAPFLRFFIWDRFGVDLYTGGFVYTEVLMDEEKMNPNYPVRVQIEIAKSRSFELNLNPSNWRFGIFWKMNKPKDNNS